MLKDLQHPSEGAIRSPAPVGNYSRTPLSIRRNAPRLGEHTEEVLREAGLATTAIDSVTRTTPTGTTNNGKLS